MSNSLKRGWFSERLVDVGALEVGSVWIRLGGAGDLEAGGRFDGEVVGGDFGGEEGGGLVLALGVVAFLWSVWV